VAYIKNCPYCDGTTTARWHDKCRIAYLEDLLAQVKTEIQEAKKGRGVQQIFSAKLSEQIAQGDFKTIQEFRQTENEDLRRDLAKQLHELAKREVMQKAAEKFERTNPDPKPTVY